MRAPESADYIESVSKDQCSEVGAKKIADRIVHYWHGKGYHGIRAEAVLAKVPVTLQGAYAAPIYSIITNIGPRGYPPLQPA